jgi:hypothetical protein
MLIRIKEALRLGAVVIARYSMTFLLTFFDALVLEAHLPGHLNLTSDEARCGLLEHLLVQLVHLPCILVCVLKQGCLGQGIVYSFEGHLSHLFLVCLFISGAE